MKKRQIISLITAVIMTLTVCLFVFSPTVSALLSKTGSITLHIADTKTHETIEGSVFRIYLFAAAYEKGDSVGYTYVVPYDECKMDINNLQDAYLPVHLTHYALTHSLEYTEKTSDADGVIHFDNLVPGVYLIVPVSIPDNYFMPSPFVVNIPLYDEHNQQWDYDINATPKMQIFSYNENEIKTTYMSVKKEWDGNGIHPDKVTVCLMRDLEIYDVVILDEDNDWYHRWNDLPVNHLWHIVEENVPDGYSVSYNISENTVTITNTKEPDSEEPTTAPPSTEPDEASTVPPVTEPQEPTTKPDELIHTGQLNWPVPVFTIAGLLLFSAGWAMLNFNKKEKCE